MKNLWWGLEDYSKIASLQEFWVDQVQRGSEEIILAGEHQPVITLGRRAQISEILTEQIPTTQSSRGGLATLHSPGQLVIYPVLNLKNRKLGVRDYVTSLLHATADTLSNLGIQAEINTCANPGVFTKNGKIAFCGVQIKNGISLHGVSINIDNDLSLFKNLIPCGHQNQNLSSVINEISMADFVVSPHEFFQSWLQFYFKRLDGSTGASQTGACHNEPLWDSERTREIVVI